MINQRGIQFVAEKPFVAVPPAAVPVPPAEGRKWAALGLKVLGGLLLAAGTVVGGLTVLGMLICH